MALEPKQERFCREYVKDHNASKAAERAGYSPKTAYSQGQRLLKKVEIQNFIKKLEGKIAEKCEIDAEWLIERFKRNYELATKGRRKQINAANQALENIGKHIGFYAEDNKQKSETLVAFLNGINGNGKKS